MERDPVSGNWVHRGFVAPRRLPTGFSRKDWKWFQIEWKKFQLVPKADPPMPEVRQFELFDESPQPKLVRRETRNTHAGHIDDALNQKN